MDKMALTIPVLSKIPNLFKELVNAIPTVNFHEVVDPASDPHFNKSEILLCDFDLLGKHLYTLPNTKWVQGTWAGIEKLKPHVQESTPPSFTITRFTGEHFGKIMSEYVVANIVSHERNFFQVKNNQQEQEWNESGNISEYRPIFDLSIGILGLGNIGRRIGGILHVFGAKVLAFGRKPSLPEGNEYSYVAKCYTKENLPSFLKESDYIINVLPRTSETDGILENDVLSNCIGRQTVLINVGRSNIISEKSLIKAINNKWLSAAILDVFDEEPLPKNNPLWKMEQVFITPHVSAMSRAKDIAEQFRSNLDLYQRNLPLPAVINFSQEY